MPVFFVSAAITAMLLNLTAARDRQDLGAIDREITKLQADDQSNSDVLYALATAYSYGAEVALELHEKPKSEDYAEKGFPFAEKLVNSNKTSAEDHRLLGELCGQVIPASPLMGTMKYGPCAKSEIDRSIELDPKLALAYVSRGVGLYYLPPSFGGGAEPALKQLDMAIAINPNLAEAYLWKGVVLAKAGRHSEAREAYQVALKLDPDRVWTKELIAKLLPQ